MATSTYVKCILLLSASAFAASFTVLAFAILYHRDSFQKRLIFGLPMLLLAALTPFLQMDMYRESVQIRKPLNDDFFFSVVVAEYVLAILAMFGRMLWLRHHGWWAKK